VNNKPLKHYPRLVVVLKVIGLLFVVMGVLFGIATWVVYDNKNAWLLDQIQTTVNDSYAGQLEIGSTELKLFRNFPEITIQLDSIRYYEKKDSLRTSEEAPILHADRLYISLGFMELVRGEVKVSQIDVSKSALTIVEYPDGSRNIDHALAKPVKRVHIPDSLVKPVPTPKKPSTPAKEPSKEPVSTPAKEPAGMHIDLESIQVEDMQLTWHARRQRKPFLLLVKDLEASFESQDKTMTVGITSTQQVQYVRINRVTMPAGALKLDISMVFDTDQQLLSIRESKIAYEVFEVSVQGEYSHKNARPLDITVDASSNDMALLSRLIKAKILRDNPNVLKEGDIYLKGRIFGDLQQGPPRFDVSFGVKKMTLQMPGNLGAFSNVGFDGRLHSGQAADYSEASLDISDLNGILPGGFVNGNFRLENFTAPHVKYQLDAKLKIDGYDQVFHMDFLSNLGGAVTINAGFDGPLNLFETHAMDSSRSSLIQLDSVSFILSRSKQPVSGLTGELEHRNNQLNVRSLAFSYGMDNIQLDGSVNNLIHYLINNDSSFSASGKVVAGQLYTNDILLDSVGSAAIQDRASNVSFDFKFQTPSEVQDMDGFDFDVRNFTAQFDELPDIHQLDARGSFGSSSMGMLLEVNAMKAELPEGSVQATGNLLWPEEGKMAFTTQVKLDKFPWTYVQELAAEIKDDAEPTAKRMPVEQMTTITADLDLTAAIRSYPFDIHKLEIRNSSVRLDLPSKKYFAVGKLNGNLAELLFLHPENSGQLSGMKSIAGNLDFRNLKLPGLNEIDITLALAGKDNLFDIGFSSASQQAKNENGRFKVDLNSESPGFELHYVVNKADLKSFLEKYRKGKFMDGFIDYSLDLKTTGSDWTVAKENLQGTIEVTGDSLSLYGVDIDDVLTKFKKSQRFNLADLGAVVVAGPLGLVATKGSDFVALATVNANEKHTSRINTLFMKWELENGLLSTEDVAFATALNRIAINGSIDFKRDSVPGIRVAVVDQKGCSLMDQQLYGTFANIQHGKLNITKTLFGSVINFVNAVVGSDCTPIYSGTVKHPAKK